MRLLLAEDSASLQKSIAQGLREHGYAVDVVGDGKQALIHGLTTDYDVLVLDLMMPEMDGLVGAAPAAGEEHWFGRPDPDRQGHDRGPRARAVERCRRLSRQALCLRGTPGPGAGPGTARPRRAKRVDPRRSARGRSRREGGASAGGPAEDVGVDPARVRGSWSTSPIAPGKPVPRRARGAPVRRSFADHEQYGRCVHLLNPRQTRRRRMPAAHPHPAQVGYVLSVAENGER